MARYSESSTAVPSEPILLYQEDTRHAPDLRNQINNLGYNSILVSSRDMLLSLVDSEEISLVISDTRELLPALRERGRNMPFILIAGDVPHDFAVAAVKGGAFDCLRKGCTNDELAIVISRALSFGNMAKENAGFQKQIADRFGFQSIVARSQAMMGALDAASKVADSPQTTVAIYGESGSGKEVLARAIHFAGGGGPSNFVPVNCAAIPETLLESELFGHVKGAFTGADKDRDGKFALAAGGSLLLDEIGDMPLQLQAKLLRVLEERVYEKIGSNKRLPADFRVIAATHRNLRDLVTAGKFREDLFHRLNVFPINVPPLRERREDIPVLAELFLSVFRKHQGKPLPGISRKAMDILVAYRWPGNVREMRNCLERAAILVNDELIRPEHLRVDADVRSSVAGKIELRLSFEESEFCLDAVVKRSLEEALRLYGGNKSLAAERLKINRKMFNRKLSLKN